MRRPPGLAALDRSRDLRKLSTDAEKLLWKHLRGRQCGGAKFRRQVWFGSYIVDFVCLDAGLVIEADGGQHADAVDYDERRSAVLKGEGLTVLRFWNNQVLTNIGGVVRMIADHVERGPSPSHRLKKATGPSLSPNGRGEVGSSLTWGDEGARPALSGWEGEGSSK